MVITAVLAPSKYSMFSRAHKRQKTATCVVVAGNGLVTALSFRACLWFACLLPRNSTHLHSDHASLRNFVFMTDTGPTLAARLR